jgi:hypothetical protein
MLHFKNFSEIVSLAWTWQSKFTITAASWARVAEVSILYTIYVFLMKQQGLPPTRFYWIKLLWYKYTIYVFLSADQGLTIKFIVDHSLHSHNFSNTLPQLLGTCTFRKHMADPFMFRTEKATTIVYLPHLHVKNRLLFYNFTVKNMHEQVCMKKRGSNLVFSFEQFNICMCLRSCPRYPACGPEDQSTRKQ